MDQKPRFQGPAQRIPKPTKRPLGPPQRSAKQKEKQLHEVDLDTDIQSYAIQTTQLSRNAQAYLDSCLKLYEDNKGPLHAIRYNLLIARDADALGIYVRVIRAEMPDVFPTTDAIRVMLNSQNPDAMQLLINALQKSINHVYRIEMSLIQNYDTGLGDMAAETGPILSKAKSMEMGDLLKEVKELEAKEPEPSTLEKPKASFLSDEMADF